MSKTIKIAVTCPKCSTKLALPVEEKDVGQKKQCMCPKCNKILVLPIPQSLASKFESDPTCIGIGSSSAKEVALVLETIPNENTAYQTFELSSDYYTIGRQNSSGPEYRPDVEVVTTDKKISRKHAAIRKKGNVGFTLKDLGSKNGVIMNGSRLDADEEVYLSDGTVFQIGDTQFRVSIAERTPDTDDLTR